MAGYGRSESKGRIVTSGSERDWIWTPKTPRAGMSCVILQHAYNSPNLFAYGAHGGTCGLADALARAGFTCIAGDMGGNTWGNDASLSQSVSAVTLGEQMTGVSGCYMIGVSMGGASSLRYMQANPTKVKAYHGFCPVTDLQVLPAGYDAEIAAVWGVANKASLPARALLSSAANKALIASIPIRLAYSTDDPVIPPSSVSAFAVNTRTSIISVGAQQHNIDVATGIVPQQDVIDFFVNNSQPRGF